MAGTFLYGERKVRPGAYFRRERAGFTVEGAINGILAVVFQSNWGPLNEEFDVDQTMLNNLEDYYGTGEGVDAIREGLIGGATTVRCVRVGGTGGAQAKVMLKTSDSTPKDAVEIAAKYEGNRDFSIVVDDELATDRRRVKIITGTSVFQQFTFAKGGNAAKNQDEASLLVAAMANNRFFVATLKNKGALATVTQQAFTGGANPTVTTDSYSKGTDVLERFRWNVIVADTNSTEVRTMLVNFANTSYETGHLGMTCIAGLKDDAFDEDGAGKIQIAASFNDEKVVYVPDGWVANDGTEFDGWRAAARIGGMIAASETNASLTHTVINGALKLLNERTNGEIIKGETHGCLMLSRNEYDQIWIDNAINTLVTCDTDQDEGWKKIRRTKCRFELIDRVSRTHDNLIGKINNDDNGRATIVAAANRIIREMSAEGKLLPESYIEIDEGHPPEGDSVWLRHYILDIDSIEKAYSTYVFRYGQSFDDT